MVTNVEKWCKIVHRRKHIYVTDTYIKSIYILYHMTEILRDCITFCWLWKFSYLFTPHTSLKWLFKFCCTVSQFTACSRLTFWLRSWWMSRHSFVFRIQCILQWYQAEVFGVASWRLAFLSDIIVLERCMTDAPRVMLYSACLRVAPAAHWFHLCLQLGAGSGHPWSLHPSDPTASLQSILVYLPVHLSSHLPFYLG